MKIAGKGSALQITISTILVTVAQAISITLPEQKMETVETDTLDNEDPGIPHDPTGRTEGGEVDVELYLDPVDHSFLTDWVNETDYEQMKKDCAVLIGSEPRATWPFSAAGCTFGGKIVHNDYIKGNLKLKLNKLVGV